MSRTKEWMLSQGLSMAVGCDFPAGCIYDAVLHGRCEHHQPASGSAEQREAAPAVSELELEGLGQLHMAVWDDQEEQAA